MKIEEQEIIDNIISICTEISTEDEIISFLGFVGNRYINNRTKLILNNSKTKETWNTTNYMNFKKSKNKYSVKYLRDHMRDLNGVLFSKEEVISRIKEEHRDKNWDYSKIEYISSSKPITIICNEIDPITGLKHGEFHNSLANIIHDHNGCPKCCKKYHMTQEEFIEKATIVHQGKYSYDKTIFKSTHDKVTIICPIHGEVEVYAGDHINKSSGCPLCSDYVRSHGELIIIDYFENRHINYTNNYPVNSDLIKNCPNLDRVLIDFNIDLDDNRTIWIEYNGEQHYHYIPFFHKNGQRTFSEQIQRDNSIREYAKDNNIEFLEIPWVDIDRIPEILEAFLYRQEDITTKIDIDYDNIQT